MSANDPQVPSPPEQHSPDQSRAPATSSAATRTTSSSSASNNPLSCVLCRQRKVKCDKGDPCSTCAKAGVKCVKLTRQRLPRGRNGGRRKADSELKARIGKLENLVKTLGANVKMDGQPEKPANDQNFSQDRPSPTQYNHRAELGKVRSESPKSSTDSSGRKDSQADLSRYIGSTYWSTLSEEVAGLREVLDHSSDDESDVEEQPLQTSESISQATHQNFNFVLCGPDSFMMSPDVLRHPAQQMREILCLVFIRNCDPVFKVLHAPTLRSFMRNEGPYLHYTPGHVAVECLSFAIYYCAICSLDDYDCNLKFGESKATLIARYRFATEVCLARADFLNTTDMATLQALAIFIISNRANDRSRISWTLVGIAVRIAHAMGLHRESSSIPVSTFTREMKRRLWHQMVVLDAQCSLDRSSDPLIPLNSFNTPHPANINDEDISPDYEGPLEPRDDFTDMTFTLMCQHSSWYMAKLNYVPPGEEEREPLELEYDWGKRWQLVMEGQKHWEKEFAAKCDITIPFQHFTSLVAGAIHKTISMIAVRPMQRHPKARPPAMAGPFILNIAVQCLEHATGFKDQQSIKYWGWHGGAYNKWHALSVCLAELCVQTEGPLVERAWNVVDITFPKTRELVADTSRGMLWRPIEKLKKKALNSRLNALQARNITSMQQQTLQPNFPDMRMDEQSPPSENPTSVETASPQQLVMPASLQPDFGGLQNEGGFPVELGWDNQMYPWLYNDEMSNLKAAPTDMSMNMLDPSLANWENFLEDWREDAEGNLRMDAMPDGTTWNPYGS